MNNIQVGDLLISPARLNLYRVLEVYPESESMLVQHIAVARADITLSSTPRTQHFTYCKHMTPELFLAFLKEVGRFGVTIR